MSIFKLLFLRTVSLILQFVSGHTMRLPVKLESRTSSMLLVSWVENRPAVSDSHTVTLYHTELGSYTTLSMDTTTSNNYRFTALDSCSPYVACVETAGTRPFTCLSTITGMVELISKTSTNDGQQKKKNDQITKKKHFSTLPQVVSSHTDTFGLVLDIHVIHHNNTVEVNGFFAALYFIIFIYLS